MFSKGYLVISAIVFGLVAVGHLARLVYRLTVRVDDWTAPMWLSGVGFVAAGILSLWALGLLREKCDRGIIAMTGKRTMAGILAVFALLLLLGSEALGHDDFFGTYMMHLSAESIAIVVTVGLIEHWNEVRQRNAEVRRLSWETLHLIQRAIWVWQGGKRDLAPSKILGHLDQITDEDPFPNFTRGLVMELGARTAQILRVQQEIVEWNPELRSVLAKMVRLASLGDVPDVVSSAEIAHELREAVVGLYQALGTALPPADHDAEWQRDSSIESQQRRYEVVMAS